MDEFSKQVMAFSRGAIVLPTELAGIFERVFGCEVGTSKSLEMVRLALENYIDQTKEAMSLLDPEQHVIAVTLLDIAVKYFREALSDVNRQLRTGDHLPDPPSGAGPGRDSKIS